jgi:hypothetical protein
LLLHERSVDEIALQLSAAELEQVINLIGRSPRLYPPGTLDALKSKRNMPSPAPTAQSLPPNVSPKKQPPGTTGADHLYRRYTPIHHGLGKKVQQTITVRSSGANAPQNTTERQTGANGETETSLSIGQAAEAAYPFVTPADLDLGLSQSS